MHNITEKINLSIVTVLGGAAVAIAFFVRGEMTTHSISETAHPAITGQLAEIKGAQNFILGDLKKAEIMRVDQLICNDPENTYYIGHIFDLITEWETITNKIFPQQLLRCADGNS